MNDHNFVDQLIANASSPLVKSKVELISLAQQLVANNWETIDKISDEIMKSSNKLLNAVDAIEIMDRAYNRTSW